MKHPARRSGVMKVGRLAKKTGLSIRTLHYYEEVGLLAPAQRTDAGHRLYGADEVVRLQKTAPRRARLEPGPRIHRGRSGNRAVAPDDVRAGRPFEGQPQHDGSGSRGLPVEGHGGRPPGHIMLAGKAAWTISFGRLFCVQEDFSFRLRKILRREAMPSSDLRNSGRCKPGPPAWREAPPLAPPQPDRRSAGSRSRTEGSRNRPRLLPPRALHRGNRASPPTTSAAAGIPSLVPCISPRRTTWPDFNNGASPGTSAQASAG